MTHIRKNLRLTEQEVKKATDAGFGCFTTGIKMCIREFNPKAASKTRLPANIISEDTYHKKVHDLVFESDRADFGLVQMLNLDWHPQKEIISVQHPDIPDVRLMPYWSWLDFVRVELRSEEPFYIEHARLKRTALFVDLAEDRMQIPADLQVTVYTRERGNEITGQVYDSLTDTCEVIYTSEVLRAYVEQDDE